MVDRNEIKTAIFAIDVGNELAHKTFEFGRISQGGARHLNHYDVANPFRVVLQQLFEGTKLNERFILRQMKEMWRQSEPSVRLP